MMEITDNYDREFLNLLIEIDKHAKELIKHDKLRLDSWIKKLSIATNNVEWKKNRNLHCIMMLDMVLNKRIEEPYNKLFDDSQSIPSLNKSTVKSKLSNKFQEIKLNKIENNLDNYNQKVLETNIKEKQLQNVQNVSVNSTNNLKENKLLLKKIHKGI